MSKNRIGLQKNCSEIFEGVWIPSRNRQKENMTEQEKEQQQQKQIEEIIAAMKCSKDFLCYKSGFTDLCEVKVVAETGFVECLPGNEQACEFKRHLMDKTFCECRLRRYIANNLHK